MRLLLLLLLFVFMVPFLMNMWHGYLKPPRDSNVTPVDCSQIQTVLEPYIEDIIRVIETYGNKVDAKTNLNSADGYKGTRQLIKDRLPGTFKKLEDYVSTITYKNMKPADCASEKYCWFLRVYNKEGHFVDWHYDNNFTRGLRYTFVCDVYSSECNTSHLLRQGRDKRIHVTESKPGNGVVYNGSTVKHAISSQAPGGCTRVALVVPLYENGSVSIIGQWRRWARRCIFSSLNL